jgi:ATP-dependent DNA helicase RecG
VDLDAPLALPGVGPKRREALAELGVGSLRDLLLLAPSELRPTPPLVSLEAARQRRGQLVRVSATVRAVRLSRLPKRGTLLRVTLADGSGRLDAVFFSQPWQREFFPLDQLVHLEGRVIDVQGPALVAPRHLQALELALPAGLYLPIYAGPAGLSSTLLLKLVAAARQAHGQRLVEHLDRSGLERLGLPELPAAVAALAAADQLALGALPAGLPSETGERAGGAPGTKASALPLDPSQHGAHLWAARRRLTLEPILGLSARILERRQQRAEGRAQVLTLAPEEREALLQAFPFELTPGQRRIVGELSQDLARAVPMRRLLQGDVGSGKTLLGLFACALAARSGFQALFLAPTELLAEQHWAAAKRFLEPLGIESEVLTGSLPAARRRRLLKRLAEGDLRLCFGTHALFSPDVLLARPALAVIDEQHRFGVQQRGLLLDKGVDLHALLMTATPIPRTLALSLYGDVDVSVLRDLPPGRQKIQTRVVLRAERGRILATYAERLARGEQGYWVAPRIDTSNLGRGAEDLWTELSTGPLRSFGVELVHGRLSAAEREERLGRFRRGESRLLVGTTVIEVGLDVPAATLITIEAADRFGLAQLHQLRGRVGRGAGGPPWCFLVPERFVAPRLRRLEEQSDGFILAEQDLSERGMGDLFGDRQAGDNQEGLEGDVQELGGFDAALMLFAREALETNPEVRQRYADADRARRRAP